MESLGLYLLKSAVWLTGFTIVFLLVLRNERYFTLNRIYLLSGIIASTLFPLYTWHYAVILPSAPVLGYDFSQLPQAAVIVEPSVPIYYWFYLVGMVGLAVRLIGQTGIVILKLRKSGYEKSGSVKLVRTSEYAASFSFFSFVFVNPSTSDIETKEIVNHESEHIKQLHWFDLLLVELLCLLQWFNPFIWIYARLIRQNHEYLADEMALQRTSNPAIYQATLLNQMFGGPVISLANSFSYSLNKKRFKMMKKKIDSPFRKLKLLMVLPFIAMVFYAFAKPEYISLPDTSTGTGTITTIADALNELKAPIAAPVDKSDKVAPVEKNKIVKGKVVNADGKPWPGTSVVIKGTTTGAMTDKDGNFKFKGVPNDAELVFSFVGYQTVVVKPDFNNPMNVKLVPATVGLDKVIVVGYGNDKIPPTPPKTRIKIDSIDSKNPPLYVVDGIITDQHRANYFLEVGVESVNVLKGKSATDKYGEKGKYGVLEITLKKDAKGGATQDSSIQKGFSFRANSIALNIDSPNQPLYILDGVIIDKAKMDAINPKDIESINILKNKDAIEKYGEKAKNGVILINLKKNGVQIWMRDGNKTEPSLYLVDGMEKTSLEVKEIDPDRIESMNVLKGESAVKKYGEKGREGVVEIKLKSANDANTGTSKGLNDVKVVGYGDSPKQKNDKEVFIVVEEMPEFPGGKEALMKFIQMNIKYPAEAQKANAQGTVLVTFIVNSNGKVGIAKVTLGVHPALNAEALRLVNSMPIWKPGRQRGVAVDVAYTLPIEFTLQ